MIHFRDDKLIGEKFNKYFNKPYVDHTQWECWQTGNLYWVLHSYLNYLDQNLLSKLGVEITVLNGGGHITKKMIKYLCNEVFSRYNRLTALISPENKQATKFVRIVGFTYEGTLRKVDKGKDVNIFSLFKEEYIEKWEHSLGHQSSFLVHRQCHQHQIQQQQLKPKHVLNKSVNLPQVEI